MLICGTWYWVPLDAYAYCIEISVCQCKTHGIFVAPSFPPLYAVGIDTAYALRIDSTMLTGAKIKKARELLGESQQEFADRFGVDQSAVSRWEQDGPPTRGPGRLAIQRVLDDLAAQTEAAR